MVSQRGGNVNIKGYFWKIKTWQKKKKEIKYNLITNFTDNWP